MSPSNHYMVYKLQENSALQDPAFTETRYHTGIFVETDIENGGGYMHHVTGDIASADGMMYQTKEISRPELSETFHQKVYLGRIRKSEYPNAVEQRLRSIPSPPRQRRFNPNTMAWEKSKPDGTPYGPDEIPPPYYKCTEWTGQRAIPALINDGVIIVDESEHQGDSVNMEKREKRET